MLKKKRSIKTSEITRRRRRMFFLKCVVATALLIVFVFALSFLASREWITIHNVTIKGSKGTNEQEIKEAAFSALEGNYFYLFPKQNALFYPQEHVRNSILRKEPRLAEVAVKRSGLQTLVVSVVERTPKYLWCGFTNDKPDSEVSEVKKAEPSPCYFLDASGYVFGQASDFSGNVYIKFYGPLLSEQVDRIREGVPEFVRDFSEEEDPVGNYFLYAEGFKKVLDIKAGLKKFDISTERIVWDGTEDATLHTAHGFNVLVRLGNDSDEELKNLKAALSSEVFRGEKGREKLQSISYFDLRYGNKVFYK